jgi:S1-C subfamily serine protease
MFAQKNNLSISRVTARQSNSTNRTLMQISRNQRTSSNSIASKTSHERSRERKEDADEDADAKLVVARKVVAAFVSVAYAASALSFPLCALAESVEGTAADGSMRGFSTTTTTVVADAAQSREVKALGAVGGRGGEEEQFSDEEIDGIIRAMRKQQQRQNGGSVAADDAGGDFLVDEDGFRFTDASALLRNSYEQKGAEALIEPNYVTKVQRAPQLKDDEKSIVELFTKSKSAVVFITNVAVRRDAFTLNLTEQPQGAGSGIVWDEEGHIVTNYHVIRDANELKVQFSLQTNRGPNSQGKLNDVLDACDAVVVGFDEDKDIAVLKLMDESCYKNKAKALPIGTSSNLLVGQRVFAIGNPFGLDHTLTTGVVSGLSRQIQSGNTGRPIDGIIQTDAAINPGNSGGPLLNSSGQLIGLNTAIYSASGTSSGVGFALPVDMVTGIVDQIIRFGRVTRPIIGVSFAPDEIAEQLGLGGVLVLDAREGGPAYRAGIRSTKRDDSGRLLLGDVIVGIDGEKIEDSYDLYHALDKHVVGDSVKVSVFRDDAREVLDFVVQLDDIKDMKPPSKNLNRKIVRPNGRASSEFK